MKCFIQAQGTSAIMVATMMVKMTKKMKEPTREGGNDQQSLVPRSRPCRQAGQTQAWGAATERRGRRQHRPQSKLLDFELSLPCWAQGTPSGTHHQVIHPGAPQIKGGIMPQGPESQTVPNAPPPGGGFPLSLRFPHLLGDNDQAFGGPQAARGLGF